MQLTAEPSGTKTISTKSIRDQDLFLGTGRYGLALLEQLELGEMTEPRVMYRGTVYPWHCDHMGHMNVMWYVGKFDEATWNVLASVGMTTEFMRSNGSATAGVEQNITYKKELTAGDVIAIHSRALEVRDRVVRIQHEMRDAVTEEIVATMVLTAVHMDSTTRRATPFPAGVRTKLDAMVQ